MKSLPRLDWLAKGSPLPWHRESPASPVIGTVQKSMVYLMVQRSKAKPKEDGVPQVDLASCLWSAGSAGISSFVPFPLLKWPPEYQTGGAEAGPPLLYTYKKKRNRFSLKRLNWSLLKARPKAPCPPDRARAEDVRSGFRHEINGFGVPTLSIQVHGRAREQDLQPPLV
jgi:hypothetical protein